MVSANAPVTLLTSMVVESPLSTPTSAALVVTTLAVVVLSKILRSAVMPVTVNVLTVMLAVVVGCVSE